MRIEHVVEKKIVDIYEIVSVNGLMVPLVIDGTLGDSLDIGPDTITVYRAPRETSDPDKPTPAEDAIIYKQHIFMINHRKREMQELDPSQKEEFKKLFKTLAGQDTIHQ